MKILLPEPNFLLPGQLTLLWKCKIYGSYITYADDTNLYWETSVDTINSTIEAANDVLDKVSTYCVDTCLRLNETKCKYIFIGSKPAVRKLNSMDINPVRINGSDLEQVSCAKVLGVLFDEVLSWQKQVNSGISKSMGNFYQMYRFRKFLSQEFLRNLSFL